jgi:hypothetical protein
MHVPDRRVCCTAPETCWFGGQAAVKKALYSGHYSKCLLAVCAVLLLRPVARLL